MTTQVVVKVDRLVKVYRLYRGQLNRLREALLPKTKKTSKEFVAINDISFSIEKGRTVGILGKNGSGKSTLLKIITGIVTPTSGTVNVEGRVAALLELGAGFNPGLTGIENIFSYCTFTGLSKAEITRVLPSIVEFADIGEHINQPVKTYSSGMFVRLAFAVAVCVDPDILIIDEALAVGDAAFTRKCFRKMQEFKEAGKTIVFVSHAVEQVKSFCDHAILLDAGSIVCEGSPQEVVLRYYELLFPKPNSVAVENGEAKSESVVDLDGRSWISFGNEKKFIQGAFGVGGARLKRLLIHGQKAPNIIAGGEKLSFRAEIICEPEKISHLITQELLIPNLIIGVALADEKGAYLFGCNTFDCNLIVNPVGRNQVSVELSLIIPYLKSGNYFLTSTIALGTQDHHVQLNWYDAIMHFNCDSMKKNIYGLMAIDYSVVELKS